MIENITLWHKRARPEPAGRDLDIQIGCHIEEFIEMMDSLNIDANSALAKALDELEDYADSLKAGTRTVSAIDRESLLDALADQIVTAVGVGVCAKMDINAAVGEVDASNWSKFNYKGYPEFDENGKIKKGDKYRPPNLKGMY
tara:strand:+ start:192 stop:620 length:429 start_codon:yes stop_codon:yes gene_type:complete